MTGPGGHADTTYLLDGSGPAAPPRDNGELTFAAPWESQAFGLALALHEAGRFDWEDFRQHLIAEIGTWEASHPPGEAWSYYGCWLSALERLVSERGLVGGSDLRHRAAMIAARPPDHGAAAHGAPDHGAPDHGAPGHGPPGHGPPGHGPPGHGPPGHGAPGHRHDHRQDTASAPSRASHDG